MKKLFITLILTINTVFADTVATSPNNAGGLIVLTDVPCPESGWYAYGSSPTANTIIGCWWSDQTMVHITWKDGAVRSYLLNTWEVNPEVAQRLGKKQKEKSM